VKSPLDERVIGIDLAHLSRTPRVVAVAGGARKTNAIHAALRSGVVNVLVTDDQVARSIVEAAG
jgi:DNA-binding transcriptional regulator LsrR (DeoR family)